MGVMLKLDETMTESGRLHAHLWRQICNLKFVLPVHFGSISAQIVHTSGVKVGVLSVSCNSSRHALCSESSHTPGRPR